MRDVVKPGIVLFVLTAVVSLLLAVAQASAVGAIEQNAVKAKEKALAQVLPLPEGHDISFSEDHAVSEPSSGVVSYNVAADGGDVYGYAVTVETKGYGGTLRVLVGIKWDGAIKGVSILEHSETPGLGANAAKPAFSDQFKEKQGGLAVVNRAAQNETEIQAITAATITSKAVTAAVNEAYSFYANTLAKGGAGK